MCVPLTTWIQPSVTRRERPAIEATEMARSSWISFTLRYPNQLLLSRQASAAKVAMTPRWSNFRCCYGGVHSFLRNHLPPTAHRAPNEAETSRWSLLGLDLAWSATCALWSFGQQSGRDHGGRSEGFSPRQARFLEGQYFKGAALDKASASTCSHDSCHWRLSKESAQ